MTTDERICMLLDQGDVEGACTLAGTLPKPAAYLAAMIRINEIIDKAKRRKPVIEFSEQAAKMTKVEADMKVVGVDNPAPTAEVDVELNMPSDMLAMFSPTLRSLLFHMNGAVQHDLASQTHDAPDVRHPKLHYPLVWEERMEGATFTVHKGLGGKSDLVLGEAAIKNFRITPMEGGTVVLEFTVRSKPAAESMFGRLATMLKSEVSISLEPAIPEKDEGDE